MSFIQLTTPLILHADPILPGHAVTKRYVDNKRANVDASGFTTGTIAPARMPALGGDVSSVAGSGSISLNVNGVTAGAYPKVTVDATGRVTAGGTLTGSDIFSVSWSKIVSGKPTTAAGYGITNLITLSGGTATGNVASSATPSAALHAVTKGYVDNAITGAVSASLSVGDVIRKTATIAPTGFLRCNGGNVSKTTFAGLFAVIGNTYVKASASNSGGKPWRMQYDFNTTQSTDITGWVQVTSLPAGITQSQVVVTSNRVYMLSGRINNGYTTEIYTAPINTDGTLGTWVQAGNTPVNAWRGDAVVVGSRIYLFTGTGTSLSTAFINADGTIGTWSNTSVSALGPDGKAFVTSGYIHYLVGNGTVSAPVNADGTLGSWVTSASVRPTSTSDHQVVVTNNRVYTLGGNGSSAVYFAPINTDGTLGTWSTGTPLPAAVYGSHAVVVRNRVYLIGGYAVTTVYSAPISADGTIGTWELGTPITQNVAYAGIITTNSRVYLLGGTNNGSNNWALVFSAPFSGGFNDYTDYYPGALKIPLENFTLPDFTSLEKNSLNYFIKT